MARKISIGEIFRRYGDEYIKQRKPSREEISAINLLAMCRTISLGAHWQKCDHCHHSFKVYNSCRNRHCPTCQQADKEEWLENRMRDLIPVGYFHLVFTIPHGFNQLCFNNKRVMYEILFKAATQSVMELAQDPKYLGAQVGLTCVLHTWGQNMMQHPHLHCIMPAGGLSDDKSEWIHTKDDFFVPSQVLSAKFRGKFLCFLKQAYLNGNLSFKGFYTDMSVKTYFNGWLSKFYKMNWGVNIQPPFAKPQKVLEYLSRYVFRIAISDHRIIGVENDDIYFHFKDYRTGLFGRMKLQIFEFMRRFLLHVLPEGFLKVRHCGILASRCKKENIAKARELINKQEQQEEQETSKRKRPLWKKEDLEWDKILQQIINIRKPNCPLCKKGRLHFVGLVRENGSG